MKKNYFKVVKKGEDTYATKQLERVEKEIKRRVKVVKVFQEEWTAERLIYLILKEMDERLKSRRLRCIYNNG